MRKESDSQSPTPSIQQKIEQAHSLYDICGDLLRQDPTIRSLLERLQGCIEDTNKTMLALGVVAECKHCEEEEGGSCCGAGIENRYDSVLLLINLLLGTSLPTNNRSQNSCHFLGEDGCLLTVRHVLCVNYVCEKLQKNLTKEKLIGLQSSAGEELDAEFVLHEAIKKRLKASP